MPRGEKSRIKITDKGYNALVKRVFGVGKPVITVGIHSKEGEEAKMEHDETQSTTVTLLDVANYMEFGTDTVPARSFVRAWFDENEPRLRLMLVSSMRAVVAGKITKGQALQRLGLAFVGEIQQRIEDGIPPPLDPKTIKRKGSSVPLIDTGQLRSGVTHRVEGMP